MKTLQKNKVLFPLLIILIVGIAYGISIPKLSFYGDDWIYIYNYHIAGAKSFTLFTQWDRPFSAWIYVLTSAVFKESPSFYHLYVLLMRLLSVFLFHRILGSAFGKNKNTDAAALFFAVYPGFQQQPIAVEYVMHFTSLVLVLLSIRLMQKVFFMPLKGGIPLFLLSLISALVSIFTCEYFVGLELSRPLFLYFTIRRNTDSHRNAGRRKKSLLFLLPYALAAGCFFVWRIFIFSFQTYQPKLLNALRENVISGIHMLVKKVLQDLWTVLIKAWALIFSRPAGSLIKSAAIFLLIAAFVFILLRRHDRNAAPADGSASNLGMLLTGCMLLLLSGIPFWGTFLDVSVSFPWDRSTLSFSPGAAVITAVFLSMVLRSVPFSIAVSAVTALAVLFHVQNAQVYIAEAEKLNDYFWQMAWRVPGLEPGTIIASDDIPLDRVSDNDISPIVNWQYAPEKNGLTYDYKYFDLDLREQIYYSDPNVPVPVDHTYRTHSFVSSTEKTLAVFYRKNGCLQIIDQQNAFYPGLPDSLRHITRISDPGLILTDADDSAIPPAAAGREPDHGYCYYYQKTALSLQTNDPEAAYTAASEALQTGLHPVYAPDLAPIILAFLQADDYDKAEAMLAGSEIGASDWEYMCKYWNYGMPADGSDELLSDFYKSHGCL